MEEKFVKYEVAWHGKYRKEENHLPIDGIWEAEWLCDTYEQATKSFWRRVKRYPHRNCAILRYEFKDHHAYLRPIFDGNYQAVFYDAKKRTVDSTGEWRPL